jgi:hypothetical protein
MHVYGIPCLQWYVERVRCLGYLGGDTNPLHCLVLLNRTCNTPLDSQLRTFYSYSEPHCSTWGNQQSVYFLSIQSATHALCLCDTAPQNTTDYSQHITHLICRVANPSAGVLGLLDLYHSRVFTGIIAHMSHVQVRAHVSPFPFSCDPLRHILIGERPI